MILPLLSLDSLGIGLAASAQLRSPRDRALVVGACGLVDALATGASMWLAVPWVAFCAVVAVAIGLTLLLVGSARTWRLPAWLGLALLCGLDNLLTPTMPRFALLAGAESALSAAVGMVLAYVVGRAAFGRVLSARLGGRVLALAGLACVVFGVLR